MKQKGFILVFILLCSIVSMFADYTVDFEAESKGSYTAGDVSLNGINWNLNNTLIGNLDNDKKNGTKSARLRHIGDMTMLEDKSGGLGTITLQYAKYGTDSTAPTLRVEYSTDGGNIWTQVGSDFDSNTQAALTEWSEEVNVAGNVRIRISSISGSVGKRANIDDIVLTDYSSSTESIVTGAISTAPFNPGGTGSVAFTSSGTFAAGCVFSAMLSDVNGSFASATEIGTYTLAAETTDPSGSINFTIPIPCEGGTDYAIRVESDDPAVLGDESANFTVNGVSVTPADDQYLIVNQPINTLTANIAGSTIITEWALSATSGGPYMPTGMTDNPLDFTPNTTGTAYLVFAAMFAEGTIYSNEIMIDVADAPTIPYHEDFSTFLPAGWQNNSNWYSSNSSYAGGVAPEATIGYNSYAVGDNLVSCPINTTGYSSLDVSWCQSISTYAGGTGSFELGLFTSTDGATWGSAVWTYTYTGANDTENQGVTIYTTDGVGSSTLFLKFEFVSQDLNRLSFWNIDELIVKDSAENQDTEAVTSGDSMIDFDSPNTGVGIDFVSVSVGGNITVMYFNEGPINTNGITNINIADYRWYVIPDSDFDFGGGMAEIYFYLDNIPGHGIVDPANVNVWHRSSELEDFTLIDGLYVSYDVGSNAIRVLVTSFSEFVFGSDDETLPVELSGFHATYASEGYVSLQWMTQSESDMLGYHVLRSETEDASDAMMITTNLVQAHNNSNETTYEYEDTDVEVNNTYYYWLNAVELDGATTLYGPTSITIEDGEEETPDVEYVTAMTQNLPNPFNPTTTIMFSLQDDAHVSLKIYNARGQLVKTLINEERTAGEQAPVVWDGTDNSNESCGSGVYFYKLETGSKTITKKMMMIK